MSYITRSGRIDIERLRKLSPRFVDQFERSRQSRNAPRLRINKSLQRYNIRAFGRGIGLNTVLQQSWLIYAMAAIVGFATVVVMLRWGYSRSGRDSALLSVALNNMTQGVILFDAHERILVCNDRYVEMYGLSPDVVKPGCTLLGLIRIG